MIKFKILITYIFISIGLIVSSQQCKAADNYLSKTKTICAIKRVLKEEKVNGIVISSDKDDSPIIIKNNIASCNSMEYIDEKRYFPIASLQKVITGMDIYKLYKEKKLKLNDNIHKYNALIPLKQHITINDLLKHESGIVDIPRLPNRVLLNEKDRKNFIYHNFRYKNNKKWKYASANYGLLAGAISDISGESYYRYTKDKVLRSQKLNDIYSFDKMNFQNMILPLKLYNNKLNNIIKVIDVYSLFRPVQGNYFNYIISYFSILKWLSGAYGAGDMVSTPYEYWKLLKNNLIDNENYRKYILNGVKRSSNNYFSGYYYNTILFGDGLTGNYNSSFFMIDPCTERILVFFSNNTSYKKMKVLKSQLYNIYYDR